MAARPPSPLVGPPPRRHQAPRRSRVLHRLTPLLAFATVAFAVGIVLGSRHEPSERRLAARFASAWEHGDYATMHSLLTERARAEYSLRRFSRAYARAADTATLARVQTSAPRVGDGDSVDLGVTFATRIFGSISGRLALAVEDSSDGTPGIAWRPEQVFPGLRTGERLARETAMPPRAAIEARDGTIIARGEARLSELGPLASEIAGRVGPAPPEREEELARRGIPEGTPVGLTGLERTFEERLAGTPGGTLKAGGRVLARSEPIAGSAVRSTIDPQVQEAAVTALAGRFGGIAVMRPRDGEVLALAGVAYSAPQPPGSTFKIITLAGLLDSGVVKRSDKFPVETKTSLEGVELENANGEACGGSLRASFAESCNSVFAPLGAKLGAERLVATAEKFGFNEEPGLPGAARSTIPAAAEIGDDLAVGSTAIGQGKVLATPLLMADVASAIAQGGRRPKPTLLKGAGGVAARAATPATARYIARAMRSVVTDGTGVGAAVPGVKVAGKTGTAELRSTVSEDPIPEDPTEPPPEEDLTDTDAWFTAFAPLNDPQVAVCVLLVGQGAGGATAAPAAKTVIEAALKN
jgi:peptidoglycan glycosyltransferase